MPQQVRGVIARAKDAPVELGVRDLAPGDYVVLNRRAVCGACRACRACRRGRPRYCFATFNATQKMTLDVDSAETDAVAGIRALTGGFGDDVVIDAIGRPETWRQAFYGRDLAGTVVLVGGRTPDMRLELPLLAVFGQAGC